MSENNKLDFEKHLEFKEIGPVSINATTSKRPQLTPELI